jgi:hypothetical protein
MMKLKVLITVDVETFFSNGKLLPFETNVYGRTNSGEFGVHKIMEICDNYGIKATFFVDVYEHHHYGLSVLENLCQDIYGKSHSVQLHAHPNFIPGCSLELMKSYDLETQKRIIGEGRRLIEEFIGQAPVAFRAGAYGINMDTILALEENDFEIDSSYFRHHKNCQLSYELDNLYANNPFMISNIFEIPVTIYNILNIGALKKDSKLDINACSYSELASITNKFRNYGAPNQTGIIVLFLHSFSFIKWRKDYLKYDIDYATIRNFDKLLKMITSDYSDVVDFLKIEDIKPFAAEIIDSKLTEDYIPKLDFINIPSRFIKRFGI